MVVPSDYAVQILDRCEKRLLPLDRAKLPNFGNLDPKLLGLPYDKANQYSIPYFWGTTGLGVNKEVIKEPVDSWAVVFDPKNDREDLDAARTPRENFAVALKLMGKSLNETDPAVLKQAADMLKTAVQAREGYDSDSFDDKLRTGEAALVHGFNGQLAKVVAENPAKFTTSCPRKGRRAGSTTWCIPARREARGRRPRVPELHPRARGRRRRSSTTSVRQRQSRREKVHQAGDPQRPEHLYAGTCGALRDDDGHRQSAPVIDKLWTKIKAQ